jgi:hypothetical protein
VDADSISGLKIYGQVVADSISALMLVLFRVYLFFGGGYLGYI